MSGMEQLPLAPLPGPVIPPEAPDRFQPAPTSCAFRTIESVQDWSAGFSWDSGSLVAAVAVAQSASAARAATARRRASVTLRMSSAPARGGIARSRVLLGVHVATEHHQCLDRFGHESGRLVGVRECVRAGPGGLGAASAGGIDLRLDDTGVAVVDGAKDRDRAAVAAGVPDEQLACGAGGFAQPPAAAFVTACATVSLSANPGMVFTSDDGRRKMSTPGSGRRPSCAVSLPTSRWLRTFSPTNPKPARLAPAFASAKDVPSTSE